MDFNGRLILPLLHNVDGLDDGLDDFFRSFFRDIINPSFLISVIVNQTSYLVTFNRNVKYLHELT
jgi:hypothetical protein